MDLGVGQESDPVLQLDSLSQSLYVRETIFLSVCKAGKGDVRTKGQWQGGSLSTTGSFQALSAFPLTLT